MAEKLFTYGPSNVDQLLTTTLSAVRKTLSDSVFTGIPAFMWLLQKGRKTEDGGATIVQPLMYGKNTTAKSYSGYGIIDTTPQDGLTAAQYEWKQYAATITISGREEMQNRGDKAKVKLLESKVKQAEMSLRDKMDQNIWATAQGLSTDFLPIPLIVDASTSIGDISKSANTWWRGQAVTGGSFNAQGLSDMRNLYNTLKNQGVDQTPPDAVFSTQTVFEYYEGQLQPQQRFEDSKMASAGFENLKYKAAMFTFDSNVPSGKLYMLNSKHMSLVVHPERDFVNTPFVKPENQDAKVAQILFMGALVSDNIRRNGVISSITA